MKHILLYISLIIIFIICIVNVTYSKELQIIDVRELPVTNSYTVRVQPLTSEAQLTLLCLNKQLFIYTDKDPIQNPSLVPFYDEQGNIKTCE